MREKRNPTPPFAKLDQVLWRQRRLWALNVLATFALFAGIAVVASSLVGWV
jgi:hypothetical protein